jgi:acetyl-CoA carboxylase biotin carboxyl carrier protein
MNLDEIRELIGLMKENGLSEIDIESAGERVRLKTAEPNPPPTHFPAAASPPESQGPAGVIISAESAAGALETKDPGVVIRSPIVGMFYQAPAPDKPPFVRPGDEIDENSVLCVIEAMKVMNEIKAETRGRVREVLAENGQPVEFGQPLFLIDPAE